MSVPEKLKCPACGEPVVRTDNQCLSCGAHLDEGRLVGAPTGEQAPTAAPPPSTDGVLDIELEREAPALPQAPAPARSSGAAPRQPATPYAVSPGAQAWATRNIPQGGGFVASLTRGWVFLKESIFLAERNAIVLVPSLLSTVCGLLLIGAFVLAMSLLARGEAPHTHVHSPLLNIVSAVGGFVIVLVSFWFMGMTVDLVSAVLRRQPATLGHAWNEACRNGLALVWLAGITTVVNALTNRTRRSAPIVGDMIADTVQTGWRAASYLLIPIVILEDIPLSRAFERAVQLHKNNVIAIIVGEIGISWLSGAISGLIVIGALVGGFFAYRAMPVALPMLIASCAGVLIAVAAAAGYVHMAYYTCLYEWAAAAEAAGEPVAAPAPLAAALGVA